MLFKVSFHPKTFNCLFSKSSIFNDKPFDSDTGVPFNIQLCATAPFAKNEFVFSTCISYTLCMPPGRTSRIFKFIVGNTLLPVLTP